MDIMEATGALVAGRLTLECQRTVALAAGDERRAAALDAAIDGVQGGLAAVGVTYPGDTLVQRYALNPAEMLLVTLAVMPHHDPDSLRHLARELSDDEPASHAKLWYALELMSVPAEQAAAAVGALLGGALGGERLITTRPDPPESLDATLHPHLAILELFGLGA